MKLNGAVAGVTIRPSVESYNKMLLCFGRMRRKRKEAAEKCLYEESSSQTSLCFCALCSFTLISFQNFPIVVSMMLAT